MLPGMPIGGMRNGGLPFLLSGLFDDADGTAHTAPDGWQYPAAAVSGGFASTKADTGEGAANLTYVLGDCSGLEITVTVTAASDASGGSYTSRIEYRYGTGSYTTLDQNTSASFSGNLTNTFQPLFGESVEIRVTVGENARVGKSMQNMRRSVSPKRDREVGNLGLRSNVIG